MDVSVEDLHLEGQGGAEVTAVLARSRGEARTGAGVLLIHDVFGLDDHMRSVTERLAHEGHVVLAPELCAHDEDRPPDRRMLADLEAALVRLEAEPDVDGERLCAVGFGMGGTLAFLLGCTSSRLAAVVDHEGPLEYPELDASRPMQPLEMALNLGCPILAFFGEENPSVERVRRTLTQFARDFEIVVLQAAEAAWTRTLSFLRERLVEV